MAARPSRPHDSARQPMESYLREINETPVLNADEEKRLAYRIQEGDNSARDHMVRANLRLVVSLARKFTANGLTLADLIAEGNLGLLRAVEAYDPTMNTRFSTYAAYWIRQAMKRAVINTARTIRVPAYMAQLLSEWRRAAARLEEELGRPPSELEIATHMKLPKKKFSIIKKALRIYQSVPQGGSGEDEPTLDELLSDQGAQAPSTTVAHSDELRQVLHLLDQLDEREATVLRLRFGLNGADPQTFQQIGDQLGLTRERVRQIERDSLKKLGEKLQAD
jgi:RNA polymerase primary sigma factor